MTQIMPKPGEVGLLVAEDVRLEHNSKLTLLGTFIGNDIKVRDIGPNSAIPLACIFYVTGGEGKFKMAIVLKAPSQTVIFNGEQEIEKIKDRPFVHIIKMINFPLPEIGTFDFSFALDNTVFPLTFTIAHDPTIS